MTNNTIKGTLIFGVLSFVVFTILIVSGMVMGALGFSCNCFRVFSWSLIGIAIISGLIFWFGVCFRDAEKGDYNGVQGHKDV